NSPSPTTSGALSVTTDPPGAHVTIDGAPAGTSPVTFDALSAEPHRVIVTGATGSAERTVTVAAGHTSTVVFSLPKVSGPVGGGRRRLIPAVKGPNRVAVVLPK